MGLTEGGGRTLEDARELVMQAMGEASMCWNPRPTGVFDSLAAADAGDRLLAALGAEQLHLAWRIAQLETALGKIRDGKFTHSFDAMNIANRALRDV